MTRTGAVGVMMFRIIVDKGLINCRFGIVVLSDAFLRRKQWTEYELSGLFARERNGEKVILPIWHGVGEYTVLNYSPSFANRIAKISGRDSIGDIVRSLKDLMARTAALDESRVGGWTRPPRPSSARISAPRARWLWPVSTLALLILAFILGVVLLNSRSGKAGLYRPPVGATRVNSASTGFVTQPAPASRRPTSPQTQSNAGLEEPPNLQEGSGSRLLEDRFGTDAVLKTDLWSTGTPLVDSIAKSGGVHPAPAQLSFSAAGLTIAGVKGLYQFTGIQSKQAFSPPFTLRTAAAGILAHGAPIEFYLVNKDLSEYLVISANLNPQNRNYHGISLNSTTAGLDQGRAHGHSLNIASSAVNVGQWYSIAIDLDARGKANMTMRDGSGAVLAAEEQLNIGRGPFYIVLGQREGWPYTAGANEGVWAWLEVSR